MTSITHRNAQAYDSHAKEWNASMDSNIAHIYLEKPAMKKLIPGDLENKSILCIGVGAGDELSDLIKQNPRRIVGIDISEKLLEIAKSKFPSIEVEKMDMMNMSFPNESFDFVYSSLAFHYSNDWDILLSGIYRIMKKGGYLLFSTHHPDYWGTTKSTGNSYTNSRGVTLTEHTAILPADIEVVYYNHPNKKSITDSLEYAGFQIITSVEPQVIKLFVPLGKDEQERYERLAERNPKNPIFFIVLAEKS